MYRLHRSHITGDQDDEGAAPPMPGRHTAPASTDEQYAKASAQRTDHRAKIDAHAKELAIASAAARSAPLKRNNHGRKHAERKGFSHARQEFGRRRQSGCSCGEADVWTFPHGLQQSFTSSLDNVSEEEIKQPPTEEGGNFPGATPIAAEVVDRDMDRDVSHDKVCEVCD